MVNRIRFVLVSCCLSICLGAVGSVSAQIGKAAKVPNTELIGQLTKGLGITDEQAVGGSGAVFGLAKSQLKAAEFKKIANVVPGMDGLLKAAPKPAAGGTDMLSSVASMIPGKAGGIASLAGSFKSLGLSPDMVGQFLPIVTQYVGAKGGSGVAGILSGVLK